MAFSRVVASLALLAVALPTVVRATEFIVGDGSGWTLGFNYTAWAEGKSFRVGDKLVFKYAEGIHNVFKVDGASFQACRVPPPDQALTSGNDVITLATPGRKWYICGKGQGQHCTSGQRLVITVMPADEPAPVASPPAMPPVWPTPGPVSSSEETDMWMAPAAVPSAAPSTWSGGSRALETEEWLAPAVAPGPAQWSRFLKF